MNGGDLETWPLFISNLIRPYPNLDKNVSRSVGIQICEGRGGGLLSTEYGVLINYMQARLGSVTGVDASPRCQMEDAVPRSGIWLK